MYASRFAVLSFIETNVGRIHMQVTNGSRNIFYFLVTINF